MASGPQPGREFLEDIDILTATIKNFAVGMAVFDTDEKFMFFNPEAERLSRIVAIGADPGSLRLRLLDLLAPAPRPSEPGASLEEWRGSLSPVSMEGRL